MINVAEQAIVSVNKGKTSFCKFIAANDTDATGAHQYGIYMPKNAAPLMFDTPEIRSEKKKRTINIKWQCDFETTSCFTYYASKNEYRLTRFGKNFPFFNDENVGDLFVLSHIEGDYYEAFILSSDDDIEDFFSAFNISSVDTNKLIEKTVTVPSEEKLLQCFLAFIRTLTVNFPSTILLSQNARNCYNSAYGISLNHIQSNPDKELLNWIEAEYQLFKTIEKDRYGDRIKTLFSTVDELIEFSNTILNRRKSRAGKSLEHHLSEIFSALNLTYNSQATTEGNKKPDFIFPNIEAYHNARFDDSKLFFLASKTTCKDRWRQIINEADRITKKHLFTLQQGISKNQLAEMYQEEVHLVVPKPYLSFFPKEYHHKILTLDGFIKVIKVSQS